MVINMNITHLEFFLAVAQYGSINKAAQVLYISQPHLSHIIKALEDEFGISLFERTKQGVRLTEQGQVFLDYSKAIMKEIEHIKQLKKSPQTEKDRLLVSMTKFTHIMESFNEICRDNQNRANFSYCLNEGTYVDVVNDIADGISDIGVIHFTKREQEHLSIALSKKNLQFQHIASLPLHVVISKNHELLSQKKPITLENLSPYGFVRFSGQYEDFLYDISTISKQKDLNSSSRIIYVHERSALLHLIAISNFYSFGIPEFTIQNSAYQCISVPLADCNEYIEFGIITKEKNVLTETEQSFIHNVALRFQSLQHKDFKNN